jgi:membrane fusion protein, multidrug efflux system
MLYRLPVIFGLAIALAGCGEAALPENPPALVSTQVVALVSYAPTVSLTGEIKPRAQNDLAFRVSGRIIARHVDVGDHVTADQVLAELDPQEQEANLAAAEASLQAAEAQLRQTSAAFDRQQQLMGQGFTTRREYDQASEAFRTAQGSLDSARAQLALARDQLSYTKLRADIPGIITARNIEQSQVVAAAQTAFSLAQDGPRDAVFAVQESVFANAPEDGKVGIALVADPSVRTIGTVREVAPTVDTATGTVRVKIGIDPTPPAMTLGSAVTGIARFKPRERVIVPWGALASLGGKPAVWVVDKQTKAVSMQPIVIEEYRVGEIIIRDGLKPGEIVVTSGAQLLRPRQVVALAGGTTQ